MTKGQLPKAYLRLDPNIDQTHPDNLDSFIRLLCVANRQPVRGLFRSRTHLIATFGKATANRFMTRGDVREQGDGTWVVPGWEEWQEGDHTVAERQRRIRDRRVTSPLLDRDSAVTSPLLDRIPTPKALGSKALGQQGSKAFAVAHLAGEGDEAIDAYYRLTTKPPSKTVIDWLARLETEYEAEALLIAMAEQWEADPNPADFLGRVQTRLASMSVKGQRDAENRRVQAEVEYQRQEKERTNGMTPVKLPPFAAIVKDIP